MPAKIAKTNQADPDQTASEEAVWSTSSLFTILTSNMWIPALKTNILFEDEKGKMVEILEYLPYTLLSKGLKDLVKSTILIQIWSNYMTNKVIGVLKYITVKWEIFASSNFRGISR